jgi:DNA-binding transcriptional MerR regulator
MIDTPENRLFSIGEFSRATGLTVKALRFYHEEGVLPPAVVDADTGYRYYRPEHIEAARVVKLLRDLDFPVREIAALMAHRDDRERLTDALARQKSTLEGRIRKDRQAVRQLEEFLAAERQGETMSESMNVQEKDVRPMLVAGIRTKGKYSDCGKLFGTLFRQARGAAGGSPMMLHFDTEYKENDADFEACVPLKATRSIKGAFVRELPGGRCVSLIHKGPYEELGRSYERITRYMNERGYRVSVPSREIYLKGPGMIFRGNPRKYVTEIQMLLET